MDDSGARTTFEQYAKNRLPELLGTARSICVDWSLAEDLVQDVLIKVHQRWEQLSTLEAPDAYVRRMVVNEYLSWRRKWARLVPHADPERLLERHPDRWHPDAEAIAERDALLRAVLRLPSKQRVVIGLRYFADLSDEQIAQAMHCARSTVRVHASRALTTLRIAQPEMPRAGAEERKRS